MNAVNRKSPLFLPLRAESEKIAVADMKRNNYSAGSFAIGFEIGNIEFLALGNGPQQHLQFVFIGKRGAGAAAVHKFGNPPIGKNVFFSQGLFEADALKRSAAAEGDIELSGGKRAPADIDFDVVKRFALAFVNCYGPGQPQRVLGEGADNLGNDFLALQGVFEYFPGVRKDIYQPLIFMQAYSQVFDLVFFGEPDVFYVSDTAVNPAIFGIIVQKHNLSAGFEFELFGGRIKLGRKIAVNYRLRDMEPSFKGFQFAGVDAVG